jgi:hypothetical protein
VGPHRRRQDHRLTWRGAPVPNGGAPPFASAAVRATTGWVASGRMTRPALLPDSWFRRDLPVLIEAVRHFDASSQPLPATAVAELLGWDVPTVQSAVRALARGGYVEELGIGLGSAGGDYIARVSADAYREAGAWPSPDNAADRLLAALQAAVEKASEGEPKNRARRILDGFVAAGRDFAVDVAAGVVTGQIGN